MARLLTAALLLGAALLASANPERQLLISEVGAEAFQHHSIPCNASTVGSVAACFNSGIKAANNNDYPFMASPDTTYPVDGSPWGIHITGPYPDGTTYLVSWYSYRPTTGYPENLTMSSPTPAKARISTSIGGAATAMNGREYTGEMIQYTRAYTEASHQRMYSYLSPMINHVLMTRLKPDTTYNYIVGDGMHWSEERTFTTLPVSYNEMDRTSVYPLRVGLIADVGQTNNSTQTRDHLLAHDPQVVILVGDYSYADNYGANDVNNPNNSGNGTNQNREDTFAVMWESVFSTVPTLGCAANHEIQQTGINAVINYTTTHFSYPDNYPFQSYAARNPVAGTMGDFGNIDNNMYYSTVIAGVITLITLNNYIPFHEGTPQHNWAMEAFSSVDRTKTPWLFVQFHAPPYHTYLSHYKEQDCFMSVYEDMFYHYGVDMVFNGHVHAYERTHPVYKYQLDTCGPIYVTIGDGGNIEGPYRNFVDEINPATNKTYCEGMNTNGLTPNQIEAMGGTTWGPGYQRQAHAPGCPTTTWQPAYGVGGGMPLVLLESTVNSSMPLGFCQSSQPLWSAYRDPSFGHGILDIMSDKTLKMSWYRNMDGEAVAMDQVTLERQDSCASRQAAVPARKASRKLNAGSK